jgi:hypothetical protein
MQQRSEEWFKARLGKVTASRVEDVLARGRNGDPSTSRKNYMIQLVAERLTGEVAESYTNSAMEWGTLNEPFARAAYESKFNTLVSEDFGRKHESLEFWASPDGLVDDGGIEIKCPNTSTHLETIESGLIKKGYIYQMTASVIIYNLKWYDFVSYDPRLPPNLQLYVQKFIRSQLPVDEVLSGVCKFLDELDALEARLRELRV